MTIEMQQREQHQQRPQQPAPDARAGRAQAAEQRNAAAAVATAVGAAHVERTRARHLGADKRRLAEAFELLSEQINGRDDMSVLDPGNVLRHEPGGPEQGTGNMPAVCEFVDRIMRGELPHEALEEMHEARLRRHLAPALRHVDASYQRAHRLENAATVQAALPPSGAVQQNGHAPALPHREPIAPSQPPMFPPAPAPTAAESTGTLVRIVEEATAGGAQQALSGQTLQSLRDAGFGGEAAGPDYFNAPVDPAFGPSALPLGRALGDTQRMEPVPAEDDDAPATLPFAPAASIAAPTTSSPQGSVRAEGGEGDES